jgi:hypothetical protein
MGSQNTGYGPFRALGRDFMHLQGFRTLEKGIRDVQARHFMTLRVIPDTCTHSQAGGEGPHPPFSLRLRLPSPPNRATVPETHASVTPKG